MCVYVHIHVYKYKCVKKSFSSPSTLKRTFEQFWHATKSQKQVWAGGPHAGGRWGSMADSCWNSAAAAGAGEPLAAAAAAEGGACRRPLPFATDRFRSASEEERVESRCPAAAIPLGRHCSLACQRWKEPKRGTLVF